MGQQLRGGARVELAYRFSNVRAIICTIIATYYQNSMMTTLLQLRFLVVVIFLTSAVTGLSVNVELDLESVAGSCLGGETLGLTNTSVLVYRVQTVTKSHSKCKGYWNCMEISG